MHSNESRVDDRIEGRTGVHVESDVLLKCEGNNNEGACDMLCWKFCELHRAIDVSLLESCAHFYFCFRFLLDRVAGLAGIPSSVSRSNDVEDELALELEELVDNPGTTIGTNIFPCCIICFAIFGQRWFLTTGPHI